MWRVPGVTISVRLQPPAGRDELVTVRDGVLVVRVTAPPVEGRANAALCRLLAKRLAVAPSRVTVIRGEHSRDKLVHIDGVDQAAVHERLGA